MMGSSDLPHASQWGCALAVLYIGLVGWWILWILNPHVELFTHTHTQWVIRGIPLIIVSSIIDPFPSVHWPICHGPVRRSRHQREWNVKGQPIRATREMILEMSNGEWNANTQQLMIE